MEIPRAVGTIDIRVRDRSQVSTNSVTEIIDMASSHKLTTRTTIYQTR